MGGGDRRASGDTAFVPLILVVDDDPDIRQLVAELLRLSGYESETRASGTDALVRLAERPLPALVLLDVQMPELDGWDTLRAIRQQPGLAELPVVLCTVKATHADTEMGWSLGCDGYIVKPFAIADLVQQVEAVLGVDPAELPARRHAQLQALSEASSSNP
jgi:two-component system KDP operon response regulator KdpE